MIGTADIAFAICPWDAFVSGTFFCLPGFVPCFTTASDVFATIFVSTEGVTIFFEPFLVTDGASCTFSGSLVGTSMGGDFFCVDPFGFLIDSGTWSATRCP
jgi:hypothetical protein